MNQDESSGQSSNGNGYQTQGLHLELGDDDSEISQVATQNESLLPLTDNDHELSNGNGMPAVGDSPTVTTTPQVESVSATASKRVAETALLSSPEVSEAKKVKPSDAEAGEDGGNNLSILAEAGETENQSVEIISDAEEDAKKAKPEQSIINLTDSNDEESAGGTFSPELIKEEENKVEVVSSTPTPTPPDSNGAKSSNDKTSNGSASSSYLNGQQLEPKPVYTPEVTTATASTNTTPIPNPMPVHNSTPALDAAATTAKAPAAEDSLSASQNKNSSSSGDIGNENQDTFKIDDIISPAKTSSQEDNANASFKVPSSDTSGPSHNSPEGGLTLVLIKTAEYAKLKQAKGSSFTVVDEMEVRQSENKKIVEAFGKLKKGLFYSKRVSDASSLSSGYMADVSSGITSSSGGTSSTSRRDRYSIFPEAAIAAHRVISPLPKNLRGPGEADTKPSDTLENIPEDVEAPPINQKKSEKKEKSKRLKSKSLRDNTSSLTKKKATEETDLSAEDKTLTNPFQKIQDLAVGRRVFAKWIEKTEQRFWPGIVLKIMNVEEEQDEDKKYMVKFDDGIEKAGLNADDLIPVDILEPGHSVNVEVDDSDGIYNPAILIRAPDCSRGKSEVFYTVELEKIPGVPHVESMAVSTQKVHLTLEQANRIREDLGLITVGVTNKKTRLSADVSLDNLLTGKRRSKPSTPKGTPSKTSTRKSSNNSSIKKTATASVDTPRSSRKRGGANVETSVAEDTEADDENSAATSKTKRTSRRLNFNKGKENP